MDIGKHPLLKQCYELCLAIERCGASLELTEAVTKASALMNEIEKITDKLASYERADRDLNEALNTGDGTYKP